jgi:hypothetical protein
MEDLLAIMVFLNVVFIVKSVSWFPFMVWLYGWIKQFCTSLLEFENQATKLYG